MRTTPSRLRAALVAAATMTALVVGVSPGTAHAAGPMWIEAGKSTFQALDAGSTTPGIWVYSTSRRETRNQQLWTTAFDDSSTWGRFVNQGTGLCLAVYGGAWIGHKAVTTECVAGSNWQQWGGVAAPGPWDGRVQLKNRATGLCLFPRGLNALQAPTYVLESCDLAPRMYFVYH